MIKYKKHSEIDKQKWDECVRNSTNSSLYAYSWFLDIVYSDQWDGIVEEKEGIYETVMPAPFRKLLFLKYFYQSPFVSETEICAIKTTDADYRKAILNKALDKFSYCAKLTIPADYNIPYVGLQKRYVLNIDQDYRKIHAGYLPDRRRNLKRAARFDLEFSEVNKVDLFLDLYDRHIRHKIDLKLATDDRKMTTFLLKKCIEKQCGKLFQVSYNHETSAMLYIFLTKTKVIRFMSLATPMGRKLGASTFITDEVIKIYAGRKLELDFMFATHDNLAYFKRSFGAEEKYYHEIHINRLPFPVKLAQNLRKNIFYFFHPKYKRYNR